MDLCLTKKKILLIFLQPVDKLDRLFKFMYNEKAER